MDPVHDAGRMSWQMNLDLSEQLTIGLFVRDDDALHSGLTWLPPPCPVALSRNPRRPARSGRLVDASRGTRPRLERPGPASPRGVLVGAAVLRRAR